MIGEKLKSILEELPHSVKLVAVSKFHPMEDILEAYNAGQRRFGENRPQEFAAKAVQLPQDIEWHFIGHLQTNKLKLVLPYASLVQSIDSLHLLDAVESWGERNERSVRVLLEQHLGSEQTKSGMDEEEILQICRDAASYPHVRFCGLMGMASNTDDEQQIREEFSRIRTLFRRIAGEFPQLEEFTELSIGMSGDWRIAVECGATIVRIGTAIFGYRDYPNAL
ncbi:MAG: YggS family pyridoxal phosphate-dependent enzyme [Bacteroidales bacterium]|nr:YggS family pyridoxal phosphate-dependent enzyme [Bacteroidales bacterium]